MATLHERPLMKRFTIALLALVLGCGGRTDNTPPGPAPSPTGSTIVYGSYSLTLYGPQFKDNEHVFLALDDASYTSLSFDLSAPAREIRASDLSQHPEVPPRKSRNTLGAFTLIARTDRS